MWIDSHCHLEADDFCTPLGDAGGDERLAVIKRAAAAGVSWLVVVGSGQGRAEIDNAMALAQSHLSIVTTIGVHPHHADRMTEELWQHIEHLSKHPRVVGLGETGLDYHYKLSPPAAQQELLRRFLQLGRARQKPISLHIRSDESAGGANAHADARIIVKEELGDAAQPTGRNGVIHCFTGNADDARAWLNLGFCISFSGIVTFKNAESIREAARIVPADRLLLETDSPYLAPVPHRGQRNEPALLVHTAKRIAELRGISLNQLSSDCRTATQQLFQLPVEAGGHSQ